jgi:DNA-binding response OmpR family regulator
MTRGTREETAEVRTLSLAGHTVQVHTSRRVVLIDQHLVPCSPTQYALLVLLLQHASRCVSYRQLLACMQEIVPDQPAAFAQARRRLQHHISHLRVLLWPGGLDIACVMGVGYLLHPVQEDDLAVSGTAPPFLSKV